MVRRNIKRSARLRQQFAQIPEALNARWLILSGHRPFRPDGRERHFIRGSLLHRLLFPSALSVHVALSIHFSQFPA